MIRAEHIVKSFDGRTVLDDISAEFQRGKTNLIIGRSGSGKTVLLKCLVGLHDIDSGSIWYDRTCFNKLGFREKKEIRRNIGMIFQGGALLDSSTVAENVRLPLDLFTNQSEAEKKELEDRYLRLMAEYDNYRRRTQKERENVYPDAVANTLKELLPLLDNLQRALDTPCADENYLTGIKMIQTGFEEYLKKMGVETFGKAGEPFDPNLHNAVMHIEDESLGKNVVAQVFQSGYRRGDRILRHAMVQQAN